MTDNASKFLTDETFQRQFCDALEHNITVLQRTNTQVKKDNINPKTRATYLDTTIDLETEHDIIKLTLKPSECMRQAKINEHNLLFFKIGAQIKINQAQFSEFKYQSTTHCTIDNFSNTYENSIPKFFIFHGKLHIHQNNNFEAEQDIFSALIKGENKCEVSITGQFPRVEISESQAILYMGCKSEYISFNQSDFAALSLEMTKASEIDFHNCKFESLYINQTETKRLNIINCFVDESIEIISSTIDIVYLAYSLFASFLFKANSRSNLCKLSFYQCKNGDKEHNQSNSINILESWVCVDLAHVNSTQLNVANNSLLNIFKIADCTISKFNFCHNAFKECKDIQLFSNNEISLIDLPHDVLQWPRLGDIDDQYCENWMLTFGVLAKNAEIEEFFDRKMLFVRMSQQFRSRCSPFPRAKLLLKLYGISCSYGTQPLFALLWWISISAMFFAVYWIILALPILKLDYEEFVNTFSTKKYFAEQIIPSFLSGSFPFLFLDIKSNILQFVIAIHKMLSGLLLFLFGFGIRNLTKLES